MKSKFSNSWISSKQIRKQRKYRANAPLHVKAKMISGHLNKELKKQYGMRSISLRKGDEVKIMRGKFKGKTGKIASVELKKQKVSIEGIQNKKKDGTKINAFFDASNLLVQAINDNDKKRMKSISKDKTQKTETKKAINKSEKKEKSEVKETKEKK